MVNNEIVVSVIIPTYRDNALLNKCIEALNTQSYPRDHFEVIVVNNDPESVVEVTVPNSLDLVILTEPKPGSYSARNKGIQNAKGDILAFTDSDCVPYPDWIENAVKVFQNNSEIDRIGGNIEQFRLPSTSEAVYWYQKIFSFNQEKNIRNGFSVTANLFIKRSSQHEEYLFNETFFSGGDYEYGVRGTKQGLSLVYDTSVTVKHPMRSSLKALIKKKKRTTGGDFDLGKRKINLKYIARCFLNPILVFRGGIDSITFFQKLQVICISWALKGAEFYEWGRLHLLNSDRARQ